MISGTSQLFVIGRVVQTAIKSSCRAGRKKDESVFSKKKPMELIPSFGLFFRDRGFTSLGTILRHCQVPDKKVNSSKDS